MTRPLRVVVSAFLGTDNLGDELIFACLLERLAALGVERDQVCAVSTDPAVTIDRFGVRAVAELDLLDTKRAIEGADLLIFGGGGLVQDKSNALTLPRQLSRVVMAHAAKVPVATFGLGVGPLTRFGSKEMVKQALGPCAAIGVRDPASAQELAECGVTERVVVHADPVLAIDPPEGARPSRVRPARQSSERRTVGVCLRQLESNLAIVPAWVEHRLGVFGQKDKGAFVSAAAQTLDTLVEKHDVDVAFFPFWLGRDESLHEDVLAAMDQSAHARCVTWSTTADALQTFATFDAVVAMRLHASILATRLGIPFRALTYFPKVEHFLDLVGKSAWGFTPAAIGRADFVDAMGHALEDAEERRWLKARSDDLAEQTKAFDAPLARLLRDATERRSA